MAQDGSSFARDFGYLMPFLRKIEQAAQQSDSSELRQLVAGEAQRWSRIQQLLGGAAASAPAVAAPTRTAGPAAGSAASAGGAAGGAAANGPVTRTLTVGSLRSR